MNGDTCIISEFCDELLGSSELIIVVSGSTFLTTQQIPAARVFESLHWLDRQQTCS
jgi:hypothetical protein